MREEIANMFRIARAEGALRKVADGKDDAEELLTLIGEKIDKVENPYPVLKDSDFDTEQWVVHQKALVWEEARPAVLKLLETP